METKKENTSKRQETPLLEKKGYQKMTNEIIPVQQTGAYSKATSKKVKEAVKELNPDRNSMTSRG